MQGVGVELVTVGNKGSTYFKKRQPGSEGKGVKTVVRAMYPCGQGPTAEEATTIANEARRRMSHASRPGGHRPRSLGTRAGGRPACGGSWVCVTQSRGSEARGRTQDGAPIRFGWLACG